ncbi:MAG: hypothetical protein ABJC39_02435 [Chloroflexota bacterium]
MAAWSVRTWQPVDPVVARGPLEAAIPFTGVDGGVEAIGVCAVESRSAADSDPAGSQVSADLLAAWQLNGDTHDNDARLFAVRVRSADLPTDGEAPTGLAVMYEPVRRGEAGTWPSGRYVLRFASPGGSGGGLWLGIQVGEQTPLAAAAP